jgi:hypothetical protein
MNLTERSPLDRMSLIPRNRNRLGQTGDLQFNSDRSFLRGSASTPRGRSLITNLRRKTRMIPPAARAPGNKLTGKGHIRLNLDLI